MLTQKSRIVKFYTYSILKVGYLYYGNNVHVNGEMLNRLRYLSACSRVNSVFKLQFIDNIYAFFTKAQDLKVRGLLEKYPTFFFAKTWWISMKSTCMRRS